MEPQVKTVVEECFGVENVQLDQEGNVQVEVAWPENNWLYGFILGFGAAVEVLQPAGIREKIQEIAGQIQSLYKNSNKF